MQQVTRLLAVALLATSTRVEAQTSSSPNQRIPVQRPIAGTVVNEQGQPVPGARLWWGGRTGFKEFTADQQGRFQALSPIEWKLVEGPAMLGSLWAEADGSAVNIVSILGGDEQTRPELDLKVKLRKPWAFSPSRLRVVDSQGVPVAQARIDVSPVNGGFPSPFSCFPGQTDSEGLFKLERMPPYPPALRVTTADAGVQDFRLLSSMGGPDTPVLKLRATARLEGRVVGPAESWRGLKIALHSVEPVDSQERLKAGVRPEFTIADAEVDGEGRFAVPAFLAGKIRIDVRPASDASYLPEVPRELVFPAGATTTVEIPMTRGIPVTGRVIDGLTSVPLPGITVTINSTAPRGKLSGRIQTTTDRDGRYRGVALPGRAGLEIYSYGSEEAGNYMPPLPTERLNIEISPHDKEKEFPEFRLTAGRWIIGRLVAKNRTGHGMQVAVDDLPHRGRCDEDGYFLLMLPLDHRPKKYIFGDWLGGNKPEAHVISTSPLVLEMPENFTF